MFPTPTPIPPQPTTEFLATLSANAQGFGESFAQNMVQGWNIFDAQNFAGLVWFILLAFIIIGGLMSIRAHLQKLG